MKITQNSFICFCESLLFMLKSSPKDDIEKYIKKALNETKKNAEINHVKQLVYLAIKNNKNSKENFNYIQLYNKIKKNELEPNEAMLEYVSLKLKSEQTKGGEESIP